MLESQEMCEGVRSSDVFCSFCERSFVSTFFRVGLVGPLSDAAAIAVAMAITA